MDKLKKLMKTLDIPEDKKEDLVWLSKNILNNNQTPEAFAAHKRVWLILKSNHMFLDSEEFHRFQ